MPKLKLPKGMDPKSVGVDDFMSPMMAGVGDAANKIGISSLFRTGKINLPDVPKTGAKVDAAFEEYLKKIAALLSQGK